MQGVNGMLRNLTARLLLRTVLTTVSEGAGGRNPLVDAVEGFLPGDGSEPSSDDVERMEYAGFLVVPVPKGPAVRLGDNSPVFSFPLANRSYRPGGGKQGETCVYNLGQQQGTRWVRQNGKIIDTSSGRAVLELDELGQVRAASVGNAKITLLPNGNVEIESAGGAKIQMDQDTLVTTLLQATHFGGNFSAPPPTATPGAALAGGVATVIGTDAAFLASMVVKAPGGAFGTLCSITFGTKYDSPPQFSIAAASPVLIFSGVIPIGLGAVRGQPTATGIDLITDLPIATGPLLLSVTVKQ